MALQHHLLSSEYTLIGIDIAKKQHDAMILCVFRSERSRIGIEVRSQFRICSIIRDALTFSAAF